MLYSAMFAPVPPKPRPMRESHYLDSAEMLQYMRSAGCTLAEAANRCGITTQQAVNRLRLLELDEGLRAFLRQEAMPENIALLLLRLPDVVSRRRVAIRIARERLCVRDAALLVEAAKRQKPPKEAVHQQHVIKVFRDVRPFRNAHARCRSFILYNLSLTIYNIIYNPFRWINGLIAYCAPT